MSIYCTNGINQCPHPWNNSYPQLSTIKTQIIKWLYRGCNYTGEYYQQSKAVKEFNTNIKRTVDTSLWKVFDESMSTWCTHAKNNDGLHRLILIRQNTEPLGKYFKNDVFVVTDITIYINIQSTRPYLFPLTVMD